MIKPPIQVAEELFRELRSFAKQRGWSLAETFRRGAELLLQVYPEPPIADEAEWKPPTSSKVGWNGLSAAQRRNAALEACCQWRSSDVECPPGIGPSSKPPRASSFMPRFPLHDLHDTEFEKLVVLVCRELMGIGITSFAAGADGGKDAKFEGTATSFPSAAAPATGKFIIQAKHTASPVGSCSDYEFETKEMNKEIPKIKRQFDDGELTHYLIFTNRRKTGGAEDRISERVRNETGVQHFWLRGSEDIERELLLHPHIARASGVDKLRSPLLFTPEDIRDVIIALHAHRQSIPSAFDSEHDYRNYPGLAKKNAINGLSAEYDTYIQEDSMPLFHEVAAFLQNPRNTTLKEQYHAVADELKGQLILHRDRFATFGDALEELFNIVHERSNELAPAAHRRLLKVIIHYMYVNCEIGQRS